MTNDTKIAIGWQAVEIESAFVVRQLFKRKSLLRTRNNRYLPNIVRAANHPARSVPRVPRAAQPTNLHRSHVVREPRVGSRKGPRPLALPAEVPSLQARSSGYEYHTRCPWAAAHCCWLSPSLKPHLDRRVSCHFPLEA